MRNKQTFGMSRCRVMRMTSEKSKLIQRATRATKTTNQTETQLAKGNRELVQDELKMALSQRLTDSPFCPNTKWAEQAATMSKQRRKPKKTSQGQESTTRCKRHPKAPAKANKPEWRPRKWRSSNKSNYHQDKTQCKRWSAVQERVAQQDF